MYGITPEVHKACMGSDRLFGWAFDQVARYALPDVRAYVEAGRFYVETPWGTRCFHDSPHPASIQSLMDRTRHRIKRGDQPKKRG